MLKHLNDTGAAMMLAVLLIVANTPATGLARGHSADDPAAVAEESQVRRVIVHESRRRVVPGFVEFEDEAMLFLRHLDGRLERFIKDRVVAIIRLVDPLPEQRGIVFLRSGQTRAGVIVADTFDEVVLEIEGVRSTVPRDLVDHVELFPPFEERYRMFKATLRPDMVDSHLDLCRWLIEEKRFDLAALELDELLQRHDSPEASQLLRFVNAQQELADRPAEARPAPREPRRPDAESDTPLISREDVNLIRVYEIDFRRPPKVEVPRETIERLLATYSSSPLIPTSPVQRKALFRAEPIRIVEELIFRLQARELYGDINVLTEPFALNQFRLWVHDAWLMNNCSTSRCHGGPDAGRLLLHRRDRKDPRVRYTNLLTLERLDVDPEWRLINYESPLDSLIIQYGLPRPVARRPHPVVRGWKPAFRGVDDRAVRRTVEWIDAMMKPRIDYPVDFDPNAPAPAAPPESPESPESPDASGAPGAPRVPASPPPPSHR